MQVAAQTECPNIFILAPELTPKMAAMAMTAGAPANEALISWVGDLKQVGGLIGWVGDLKQVGQLISWVGDLKQVGGLISWVRDLKQVGGLISLRHMGAGLIRSGRLR